MARPRQGLLLLKPCLGSGPMSRSALAEETNSGRSALTEISDALLQAGLLLEVAVVRNNPGKGRPSTLLSVNPERGYFVGVDVGENPSLDGADKHGWRYRRSISDTGKK